MVWNTGLCLARWGQPPPPGCAPSWSPVKINPVLAKPRTRVFINTVFKSTTVRWWLGEEGQWWHRGSCGGLSTSKGIGEEEGIGSFGSTTKHLVPYKLPTADRMEIHAKHSTFLLMAGWLFICNGRLNRSNGEIFKDANLVPDLVLCIYMHFQYLQKAKLQELSTLQSLE